MNRDISSTKINAYGHINTLNQEKEQYLRTKYYNLLDYNLQKWSYTTHRVHACFVAKCDLIL